MQQHPQRHLIHQRSGVVGIVAAGGGAPARRRCEGTAMGAITLDLRPGLGLGPFILGNNPSPPLRVRLVKVILPERFCIVERRDFRSDVQNSV